jgi:hypothetical protein
MAQGRLRFAFALVLGSASAGRVLDPAVDSGGGFVVEIYGTTADGMDAGEVFLCRRGLQEEQRVRGL